MTLSCGSALSGLLLQRCFREVDGELVPDPILVADPSSMENALGSFLHLDQADCAHLLGVAQAEVIGSKRSTRFVEEAIRLLESDAGSVPGWIGLTAILHERPIQAELADRLRAILDRVELAPLAELETDSAALVLQAVAWGTVRVGDDGRQVRIEAQLVRLAGRLAEMPSASASDEGGKLDWYLVEAVAILSSHEDGLEARTGVFARILGRLYDAYPRLAGLTRPAIQRFVDRLPLKAAKPLMTLHFMARRAA